MLWLSAANSGCHLWESTTFHYTVECSIDLCTIIVSSCTLTKHTETFVSSINSKHSSCFTSPTTHYSICFDLLLGNSNSWIIRRRSCRLSCIKVFRLCWWHIQKTVSWSWCWWICRLWRKFWYIPWVTRWKKCLNNIVIVNPCSSFDLCFIINIKLFVVVNKYSIFKPLIF